MIDERKPGRSEKLTTAFSADPRDSTRAINGRTAAGAAWLAALAAAILFSTGGAAIKTGAFSVAQVSCVRSGIAALALLAWSRGRLDLSLPVAGIGLVYAAVMTLFVASTKLTTAANAIFLQSAAPLYLLVLGPLVLKEAVRRRDVVYMTALGAGVVICFLGTPAASASAPNPALGNVLGLVCSILWATTLMALRWAQRDGRDIGLSAVIVGNAMAAAAALPFALPLPAAPLIEWSTLLYLGVIQIGLAYVCLTTAMRQLPALEVSLVLLLEPVMNPLWTWLVRGEAPGPWALVGGGVIVAATAGKSLVEFFRVKPEPAARPV